MFDGDGHVSSRSSKTSCPVCNITSNSKQLLTQILEFAKIKGNFENNGTTLSYSGQYCVDFLNRIYKNANYYLQRKHHTYFDWCEWKPGKYGYNKKKNENGEIIFVKTDIKGEFPTLHNGEYYLSAVNEHPNSDNNSLIYDTGLRLNVKDNHWYDLELDKSVIEKGYDFGERIVPIDKLTRSNILVTLRKTREDAEMLELPFVVGSLKKNKIVKPEILVVDNF